MARSWSKSETEQMIQLRMQGRTWAETRDKLIGHGWRPRSQASISDRFDRCADDIQKDVADVIKRTNMRRGRGVPIEVRRVWAHQARAVAKAAVEQAGRGA